MIRNMDEQPNKVRDRVRDDARDSVSEELGYSSYIEHIIILTKLEVLQFLLLRFYELSGE